ncbi:YSIRK-targeted surface antigen transcriptional regulator [Enterococcus faecalis]|uniref:YSIRK-targeted surface antigen transcriptional regulator n=1 Tax=Enterococcus faecalis TaxID=1351 RepID=UPI001D19401A|nr:YSIRK-targeted surface antigen transcriptional regulator [Enterococcus faecalis]MCC4085755.1 YSIRK-targeted surface antigen transcriptional regulator [Enterococcus faecalis]
MYRNEKALLKLLHVSLKLPIVLFDEKYNIVEEYKSDRTLLISYDFKLIIKKAYKENLKFSYINGNYNELFLLYVHDKNFFLFGPFICNRIDKKMFDSIMQYQDIKNSQKNLLYNFLNKLPLFSLGDTRDILMLINYLFTGEMEDLMHIPLHNHLQSFVNDIQTEKLNTLLSQNYDPEAYLFLYEKKILQYVESGNIDELKKMIFTMSNGVVPSVSGNVLRSEKNYSIIVFEKLAHSAIAMGMDVINAYQSRDSFVRRNELSINITEVLQIRDMAIVYYTSEIRKARVKKLSPLVSSIVQYIGLNMYTKISVKKIACYFSMSEAKLRVSFKREMHISIHNYILKRKVSEAKVMLKANIMINEIALLLGFCDSSHFSKVFKKLTGTTPKQYQMSLDSK